MNSKWALQDAKNRFSEVVESAQRQGPQTITRRGKETAVLMSMEDFRKLTGGRKDLVTFFQESPLAGSGLALDRDDDTGRKVDL